MGRKRSRVAYWEKKQRDARLGRWKKKIRSKYGLECPWCHDNSMFVQSRGSGRLLLFGCPQCNLGEMLPKHPTWKIVDMYHMILDNYRKGTVPEFKWEEMLESDYEFLRNNTTLGKITVREIVEEEE